MLHTNFIAPVSLLTWLANYCAQRHAGTLAVLSSVAGERGRKSNYVYGSSKAGLTAFVDGLRNRVDREGVARDDHQARPGEDRHDRRHEGRTQSSRT